MNSGIWRVTWNLVGTKGPPQSVEFTKKDKAIEWAAGLLKGGANGIFLTELIIGKSIRIDTNASTLPFQE